MKVNVLEGQNMRHGRVYWITGLSGSGKTTVGVALYYQLKKNYENVIILDGDILKLFVGDKVGYSNEERLQRAKKYSTLCKMLADQGMYVIICTIAMFDEVRLWNRRNIHGYVEVFLDVSLEVLQKRNKKNLYSSSNTNQKGNVVGLNANVEFPTDPDIRLVTDGSVSVTECVEKIESLIPRRESDFDRDSNYWNKYYANRASFDLKPSGFAVYLMKEILSAEEVGKELLEIGCGNGRDSLYFLLNGVHVTGIDASEYAINELQKKISKYPNAIFICDDFVKCKAVYQRQYDYIYSRFTLHAINESQQAELFSNIVTALKPGGKLYIEARTIHDDLYGKGEQVSEHAFLYNDHYRRFVEKDEIARQISTYGLKVLHLEEARGFSKTDDSDPILMRLVATAPE